MDPKNIRIFEEVMQKECNAIIKVNGKLYCFGCGKEISKEYQTGNNTNNPYHHPLCERCRLEFQKISDAMEQKSDQLPLRLKSHSLG